MRIIIIPEEHCIECEGIKYSFEMFGRMAETPEGTYFRLTKREDGQLTVTEYEIAKEINWG